MSWHNTSGKAHWLHCFSEPTNLNNLPKLTQGGHLPWKLQKIGNTVKTRIVIITWKMLIFGYCIRLLVTPTYKKNAEDDFRKTCQMKAHTFGVKSGLKRYLQIILEENDTQK